jgi:hypothetical protein
MSLFVFILPISHAHVVILTDGSGFRDYKEVVKRQAQARNENYSIVNLKHSFNRMIWQSQKPYREGMSAEELDTKTYKRLALAQISHALELAVSMRRPEEAIDLVILAHGNYSEETSKKDTDASENTISLGYEPNGSSSISYSDLSSVIQSKVPSNLLVRISGIQCYAGSHLISFRLPNVCSSTFSDFRDITRYTFLNLDFFGRDFGQSSASIEKGYYFGAKSFLQSAENLRPSLFERHLAGTIESRWNTTAQLSSTAWMDSVLGVGAFENGTEIKKGGYLLDSLLQGLHYNVMLIGVWSGMTPRRGYSFYFLKNTEQNVNRLVQVIRQLNHLLSVRPPLKSIFLPDQDGTVFHAALEDWETNSSHYLKQLDELNREYEDLIGRWQNLSALQKARGWKQFTLAHDEFEDRAKHKLSRFLIFVYVMREMGKVELFLKKATLEQKLKWLNLLQYEWY